MLVLVFDRLVFPWKSRAVRCVMLFTNLTLSSRCSDLHGSKPYCNSFPHCFFRLAAIHIHDLQEVILTSSSLESSNVTSPRTANMGAIANAVCHISKAAETLNYLEEKIKTDPKIHTTIKMGVAFCKEILTEDSISPSDKHTAALEFLGTAFALCDLKHQFDGLEFKYHHQNRGIFWKQDLYSPEEFRRLSARLWDESVQEARIARIEYLTCHNNDHRHNKRGESTFDQYEQIEQSIEQDINNYIATSGPLKVNRWISAQSGVELKPIDENPAYVNFIYDVAHGSGYFANLNPTILQKNTDHSSTDFNFLTGHDDFEDFSPNPTNIQSISNMLDDDETEVKPNVTSLEHHDELDDQIFIPELVKAENVTAKCAAYQSAIAKFKNFDFAVNLKGDRKYHPLSETSISFYQGPTKKAQTDRQIRLNQRTSASHQFCESHNPLALPSPSFYQKKTDQTTTNQRDEFTDEWVDFINLPPSPPLSIISLEDSTDAVDDKASFSTTSTRKFDQIAKLPIRTDSPINGDFAEQLEELATLEATFFFFASPYIRNSNIGTVTEKLNALCGIIGKPHVALIHKDLLVDKVMELVHSIMIQQFTAHKTKESKHDIPHFSALKRLFQLKTQIDALRAIIHKNLFGFISSGDLQFEDRQGVVEKISEEQKSIHNKKQGSKKKLEDLDRQIELEARCCP